MSRFTEPHVDTLQFSKLQDEAKEISIVNDSNESNARRNEIGELGKPEWRPMLGYHVHLHERSIHPPIPPFPHKWEDIGPGYCYGPAFGHWDIAHQILDSLPVDPEHAFGQVLNLLSVQQPDGCVPGAIRWHENMEPEWFEAKSYPPVWVFAAEAHHAITGSLDLIRSVFSNGQRLLEWFEKERATSDGGYYYCDIISDIWESGVDEGIRFIERPEEPQACVDATAHVYALAKHLAIWADRLGKPNDNLVTRTQRLQSFIRDRLFDQDTGFFHDAWTVGHPDQRVHTFEGMWPLVVGAASPEQAKRVVHDNLMCTEHFFTKHPISTVSVSDQNFELRMWRGPAWNSMTYWAALGCSHYGYHQAATAMLERALDWSAYWFDRTGTIWEFYHPHGKSPESVQRKPDTQNNIPCRDYLGHNPLIAMARLHDTERGRIDEQRQAQCPPDNQRSATLEYAGNHQ